MARDSRRQIGAAQNFVASAPISFDLPRDAVYKEIVLQLEVQISTPGAMTPPSVQFDRAPWTNVKRIDLVANGSDVIKSYDGGTLLDINQGDFQAYPMIGDITPAAGTNTGLINNVLIMSLESVGMQQPETTFLDSRKLSTLELRVTWGAGIPDMFGTVGNAILDTCRMSLFSHEILDLALESIFAVNQEIMTSSAFPTNTATGRQFRLNIGNAYRRILLSEVDQNSRAAVNRLQMIRLLQQGSFYRRVWHAGVLKQHNTLSRNLAVGMALGDAPGVPAVPTTGRVGGMRVGVYYLDFAEDGSVSSLIDTRGFSDMVLDLDWDGANTTDLLRITPTIIVPSIR